MIDYTKINEDVKQFVIANNDGETPIIDLISEFCLRYDLSEELVGDAISEDSELVKLIAWNINSNNNNLEDF